MRSKAWYAAAVTLAAAMISGCSAGAPAGDAQTGNKTPPSVNTGTNVQGTPLEKPSSPSPGETAPPAAATPSKTPDIPKQKQDEQAPTDSEQAKKLIDARANEVVAALKDKDMSKLKTYVHPQKGIRFSPYSYVDVKKDLVFTPDQIAALMQDSKTYTWGSFDGSGEPIALTFGDYFGKFLYDHDYAKAEKISYNETLGKGNMKNNIKDVYPNDIVVEYHFTGFDKKLEGMDWASLRLIFEHTKSDWMLVGIAHDQWTT